VSFFFTLRFFTCAAKVDCLILFFVPGTFHQLLHWSWFLRLVFLWLGCCWNNTVRDGLWFGA
jgi:hypothetical protein